MNSFHKINQLINKHLNPSTVFDNWGAINKPHDMKKLLYLSFAASLFVASCKKEDPNASINTRNGNVKTSELNVPANFDWQSNQTIALDLSSLANGSSSKQNIKIYDERGSLLLVRMMKIDANSKLYVRLPKSDKEVYLMHDETSEVLSISGSQAYLSTKKGGGRGNKGSKSGKGRKGGKSGKGGKGGKRDGCSTPTPTESCACDGKMQNFTVVYNGASTTTFYLKEKVQGNSYSLVYSISNVNPGDTVTFNGFDKHGRLASQSFVKINGTTYKIHTSCSEDIMGNVYGPIEVIAYTDGNGAYCGPTSTPPCIDSDGDGCCDNDDAFPNDPTKCDIQYLPAEDVYGSYAFEDLWPSTGDFDFNDKVVDRTTALILNSNGDVVEAEHKFVLRACGAGYKNGFAFSMPNTTPAEITSVTSSHTVPGDYTVIDGKGLEAGQSKAVVILYENWNNIVTYTSNGKYFNTIHPADNGGLGYSDTITVQVIFAAPQLVQDVLEIDPFVIRNGNRNAEIHLPWFGPTDLADPTIFNTFKDASAYPAMGNNYVTANNIPWGIETPLSAFEWPLEKQDISTVYFDIVNWALTGVPADWYTNGNVNPALLY